MWKKKFFFSQVYISLHLKKFQSQIYFSVDHRDKISSFVDRRKKLKKKKKQLLKEEKILSWKKSKNENFN